MTDRAGAPAARPGAESHDKSEAHLFVFTADKAGMGGLDKDRINRTIYEMSAGSNYFVNAKNHDLKVWGGRCTARALLSVNAAVSKPANITAARRGPVSQAEDTDARGGPIPFFKSVALTAQVDEQVKQMKATLRDTTRAEFEAAAKRVEGIKTKMEALRDLSRFWTVVVRKMPPGVPRSFPALAVAARAVVTL